MKGSLKFGEHLFTSSCMYRGPLVGSAVEAQSTPDSSQIAWLAPQLSSDNLCGPQYFA